MTIYKTLAKTEINGKAIIAREKTEKFSNCPAYEIVIDDHTGPGVNSANVHPAAKTTWRKKYNELITIENWRAGK